MKSSGSEPAPVGWISGRVESIRAIAMYCAADCLKCDLFSFPVCELVCEVRQGSSSFTNSLAQAVRWVSYWPIFLSATWYSSFCLLHRVKACLICRVIQPALCHIQLVEPSLISLCRMRMLCTSPSTTPCQVAHTER